MTDVAIAPTPITQRQHEWLAARLVELDAVLRSLNALRYWSVPGCDAVQTPLEVRRDALGALRCAQRTLWSNAT